MQKLSQTQHKLIQLRFAGASRHEIAEALGMTEDGVKYHLKQIYQILDVRNSVELLLHYGVYRRTRGLPAAEIESRNKKIKISTSAVGREVL